MSLSNYTDLKASIGAWLDRTDLTSVIPDFIAMFEANANTDPAFKSAFNRTSTTLTTVASQNYANTPSDLLVPESVILNTGGNNFVLTNYGTASSLYTQFAATTTGQPKGFIVLNGKLEFAPSLDSAYAITLYYYQKIPALATYTTNWLLTNYPQIYLYGTLIAAESYLGTDPAIQKWGNLYDNAVQKLQGQTDRNKYSGGPLTVRVDAIA